MDTPRLLALHDVRVGYGGRRVLHALDLTIERGLIYAVVGPTGCGKTTLLHVIAGLLRPERGSIDFERAEDRRRVALIPQDYGLFPWKTVESNARMGLEIHKRRRLNKEEKQQIRGLLANLGLAGLERRWPATLSGGQKQRTAIARAIAPEPALLLMDEPFSALDADIRESLQDLLRTLPSRHGATPILVTHDIREALRVADKIILFRGASSRGAKDEPRFAVDSFSNDASRRDELEAELRSQLRAARTLEEKRDA